MKNGGPAFPVPIAGDTAGFVDGQECGAPTGLTIRDYFAAKAMQLMVVYSHEEHEEHEGIAKACYHMADAMLRAREGE